MIGVALTLTPHIEARRWAFVVALVFSLAGDVFLMLPGDFFVQASVRYGVPHIPVINSNNAGGITVQIADLLTSGTPNVTIEMAQLSQKLPNPAG